MPTILFQLIGPIGNTAELLQLSSWQTYRQGEHLLATDGRIFIHCKESAELAYSLILFDAPEERESQLDPNGIGFQTSSKSISEYHPWAATWLEGLPNQEGSTFGKFYEMSLYAEEYDKSLAWWQKRGFTQNIVVEKGWCGITNGTVNVGLYDKKKDICKHLFNNPALTWFEPDFRPKLAQLKDLGIVFEQEMKDENGIVNHGIIQLANNSNFFLFSFS